MLPALGDRCLQNGRPEVFHEQDDSYTPRWFRWPVCWQSTPTCRWRCRRAPIISWGNPRSLEEIWWHMTGRQYQVFFSFTPKEMGRAVSWSSGEWRCGNSALPWVPMALAPRRRRFRQRFQTGPDHLLVSRAHAERRSGLRARLLNCGGQGCLLSARFHFDRDCRWVRASLVDPVSALSKAVAGEESVLLPRRFLCCSRPRSLSPRNWPFNNRRHYFIASDYVENLLGAIEPNGLLLTFDWQVASPMLYAQEVEQRRRDVKVVDVKSAAPSVVFRLPEARLS